jgi:hypothetical protein
MPRVPFESLPPSARLWVFGAERPITGSGASRLLGAVDEHQERWNAHGSPLTCARQWTEDRFLAIGVDQSTAGASGCSIDGLFRVLKGLETELGTPLVGGGTVYYRDPSGPIVAVSRDEFSELAADGAVRKDTKVFDMTVATVGDWNERFEIETARSWHANLLPEHAG